MTQTGPKNPIDGKVGENIKARRTKVGISQTKLALELDITFQQVQKYEKGSNRVSASRLYEIAKILDVPLIELFDGVEDVIKKKDAKKADKKTQDKSFIRGIEFANTPRGAEVMKAFGSIEDKDVVSNLAKLVLATAEAQ